MNIPSTIQQLSDLLHADVVRAEDAAASAAAAAREAHIDSRKAYDANVIAHGAARDALDASTRAENAQMCAEVALDDAKVHSHNILALLDEQAQGTAAVPYNESPAAHLQGVLDAAAVAKKATHPLHTYPTKQLLDELHRRSEKDIWIDQDGTVHEGHR
jgi:hypothetical protein